MLRYGSLRSVMYVTPPNPVFGADDRVSGGGGGDGLPPELQGKSAAEIARYYQQREDRLRAELTPPPAPPVAPPPPPGPTNTEFWNDPNRSTERVIETKALTKAEYEQVRRSTGPALIWAAKASVKEKYPDFARVENEINQIMSKVPEWQHTDPIMWETAYIYAKGQAHDRLSAEDKARPPVATGERVNPGGSSPPVETDLNLVTLPGLKPHQTAAHVAEELGVTADAYRKSQKILEGDGLLPLTYDNRRTR